MTSGPRFSPPGARWVFLGHGHTQIWLHDDTDHPSPGGNARCMLKACWTLAGELRRDPERIASPWRAFPAFGPPEFPQRFDIHWDGMVYLQEKWLAAGRPQPGEGGEPVKVKRKRHKTKAERLEEFFGQDPFLPGWE